MAWRAGSVVVAVALMGCGAGKALPETLPIQQRAELLAFASCAELEQYVEDTAVQDMRSQLQLSSDSSSGIRADAPTLNAGAETTGKSAGPQSYTTTNTQVAGVDEADFVKNDGTRVFVLSANTLYLNQSWPANELKTLSKLEIEGYPREMFLDEKNHLVVFSSAYTRYPMDRWPGISCLGMECGYSYSTSVKVTVIDVADLSAPKVTQQYFLPGQYASSRRIGASVRIVTNDAFQYPAGVRWSPDYQPGLYEDKARLAAAYDALVVENEKKIRTQDLAGWMPQARRKLADGTVKELGYDCTRFHRPNAPAKLGIVSVATLNLDSPDALRQTSIVAQSGELYASPTSLYVATRHWWWWPAPGQADHTYLHKFDITQPDDAVYVASGGVAGHIVDQFSMDEHNGFFRVATTLATRVADTQNPQNRWGRIETTNRVSVLAEQGGALNVVGQTEDLAPGERLFSSRFQGDRGYLVTFRQVDPFFTLDLSNPSAPKKVGELKIPGFSTYLHPVDAQHILAVGTYVPENNADWQQRALKLSLFDVSDFANPKEQATALVGTAYASSEALWDHKAFNYFPEKKLLAIPFTDWNPRANGSSYWSSFNTELKVFSVDPAVGITPRGAVSLKDMYQVYNANNWSYFWVPAVRRSVMADDFVYAISDAGIRVAHISNLSAPVGQVSFDRYVPGTK